MKANPIKDFVFDTSHANGAVPGVISGELGGIYFHKSATAVEQHIRYFNATAGTARAIVNIAVDDGKFTDTANDYLLTYKGHGKIATWSIGDDILNQGVVANLTSGSNIMKVYGVSGETFATTITVPPTPAVNYLMTAKLIQQKIDAIAGFSPIDAVDVGYSGAGALPLADGSGIVTIDGVDFDNIDFTVVAIDGTDKSDIYQYTTATDSYASILAPTGGEYVLIKYGTVNGSQNWAYSADLSRWVSVNVSNSDYTAGIGIDISSNVISLTTSNITPISTLVDADKFIFDNGTTWKSITKANLKTQLGVISLDADDYSILYQSAENEITGVLATVNNSVLLAKNNAAPVFTGYSMPTTASLYAVPYFSTTASLVSSAAVISYHPVFGFTSDIGIGIKSGSYNYLFKSPVLTRTTSVFLPDPGALTGGQILYLVSNTGGATEWGYADLDDQWDIGFTLTNAGTQAVDIVNQDEIEFIGATNQITLGLTYASPKATLNISLPKDIQLSALTETTASIGILGDTQILFDRNNTAGNDIISLQMRSNTFNFGPTLITYTGTSPVDLGTSAAKRFKLYGQGIFDYVSTGKAIAYTNASSQLQYLTAPTVSSVLQWTASALNPAATPTWKLLSEIYDESTTIMQIVDIATSSSGGSITLNALPTAMAGPVIGRMIDDSGEQLEIEEVITDTTYTWTTTTDVPADSRLILIGRKVIA